MSNLKAIKTYFDMPAGMYCGLLLEKRLGIRMQKLLMKQEQEIRELLAANIDETEVSECTLVYPDGEQTNLRYFDPSKLNDEKFRKVELFSKSHSITKCDEVFLATDSKMAKENYLSYHDKVEPNNE